MVCARQRDGADTLWSATFTAAPASSRRAAAPMLPQYRARCSGVLFNIALPIQRSSSPAQAAQCASAMRTSAADLRKPARLGGGRLALPCNGTNQQ